MFVAVEREEGDPRGEGPLFLGDRLICGLDMAVFGLITCDDRETREREACNVIAKAYWFRESTATRLSIGKAVTIL